jgi:hypothetical protein
MDSIPVKQNVVSFTKKDVNFHSLVSYMTHYVYKMAKNARHDNTTISFKL